MYIYINICISAFFCTTVLKMHNNFWVSYSNIICSDIIMLTNRKEGNDQESIQLPNTVRPRHKMERKTHNQNSTSRKPKGQLFTENWPNVYQKSKFDQDIYAKHNIQWQKKLKKKKKKKKKKGKRKVQRALQSQTAALPRHQEEEETDKTKQALIEKKRTINTKISSLFPKRGNHNAKRAEKHKNKITQGKT